ncbi:MAG: ABC-2 family transporter protein [Mycobacteriales bacterium]
MTSVAWPVAGSIRRLGPQARAIGKTFSLSAIAALGDSKLRLLDSALRIVRVVVLLALWRSILGHGETANGFGLGTLLTYTLVGELFAEQLSAGSDFGNWIWEGSIVSKMVYPFTVVGQIIADVAGQWTFGFVSVSIPILVLAPLLGVDPLPADARALFAFIPAIALSVIVGLAIDFILALAMAVYDLAPWLVANLRAAIAAVLAGTVIPLAILPWGLGTIFQWLPFASMGSAPLLIYTGSGHVARLLLVQTGWAAVMTALAAGMWRASRERLVSYGG